MKIKITRTVENELLSKLHDKYIGKEFNVARVENDGVWIMQDIDDAYEGEIFVLNEEFVEVQQDDKILNLLGTMMIHKNSFDILRKELDSLAEQLDGADAIYNGNQGKVVAVDVEDDLVWVKVDDAIFHISLETLYNQYKSKGE